MRRMMWRHLVFALFLFGIVALELTGAPPAKQIPKRRADAPSPATEFALGKPLEFKNLAIFPVLSRTSKNEDTFITLDEGLKAGTVVITELGAAGGEGVARTRNSSANQSNPALVNQVDDIFGPPAGRGPEVNRLALINRSEKPLYLMPGEIIIGGQQDRTLAHETIIPPGGKEPVPLDVYCVEHGRWAGRAGSETIVLAQTIAQAERVALDPQLLSDKAEKGEFVKSAGNLSKSSRQAVQAGKGQSAVWDEVRSLNAKSGAQTQSDAFTANYSQDAVVQKLQPYVQQLQDSVAKQDRIVGVIVAINGKPEMADVFNSTPLFRKLWPKLLKSYALDASHAEPVKDAKPCTVADAQAFFDSASRAAVVETNVKGHGLTVTAQSSDRVDSFSALACPADPGRVNVNTARFGSGVHSSAFSK